jgi:transcriptional regulator with XRE-family HTH domain
MVISLSTVCQSITVGRMETRGLGAFVRDRRRLLGLTQAELAERAGVLQASVSDLERGRVALPGADARRRLAAALGVPHVDLLVAAGELTAEEAGRPVEDVTDPARAEILALLDRVEFNKVRREGLLDDLRRWLQQDREREELLSAAPVGEAARS